MIKSRRINGRTDVKISGEGMSLVAEMAIIIEKVYESLDEIGKKVFKDNWENFCPFIPKEERMKKSIEHIADSFLKLLKNNFQKVENENDENDENDEEETIENLKKSLMKAKMQLNIF